MHPGFLVLVPCRSSTRRVFAATLGVAIIQKNKLKEYTPAALSMELGENFSLLLKLRRPGVRRAVERRLGFRGCLASRRVVALDGTWCGIVLHFKTRRRLGQKKF